MGGTEKQAIASACAVLYVFVRRATIHEGKGACCFVRYYWLFYDTLLPGNVADRYSPRIVPKKNVW